MRVVFWPLGPGLLRSLQAARTTSSATECLTDRCADMNASLSRIGDEPLPDPYEPYDQEF
jgi:hypothetical protein